MTGRIADYERELAILGAQLEESRRYAQHLRVERESLLEALKTVSNRIRGFEGVEVDYGVSVTLAEVLRTTEAAIKKAGAQ